MSNPPIQRKHSHRDMDSGSIPRPQSIEDFQRYQDDDAKKDHELLWNLMCSYMPSDKLSIQKSIVNHVEYSLASSRFNFNDIVAYLASAKSLRDRLIESWNDTVYHFRDHDVKRVSYLSLEFLMGRTFRNALVNVDLEAGYTDAISELGFDLKDLYEQEPDAALGNGGLGRLAACFLDSMASCDLPAWGYGIRYTYGIFEQVIVNGEQIEQPDYWLTHGNPWEIQRNDVSYPIRFYGYTVKNNGKTEWKDGEIVEAIACDSPIPGYDTYNTINLRLWKAAPSREFDLAHFNEGRYSSALEARQRAETITSVLYPNDNSLEGKELRLKQQYFFVAATLKDLIKHFKRLDRPISEFGKKNAIQLNDTHPSIAIAELFRILMDYEGLTMDEAWPIVEETFSYTNHTVLPEALERWDVRLMEHLLPRHLQIIYAINWKFLNQMEKAYPDDLDLLRRVSIVEEGPAKYIRMAYLSIVCSHHVNGVAALHTEIIKESLFKDFYAIWPKKFVNMTNGVTPRRWMYVCNTPLANLITKWLGTESWLKDLSMLEGLRLHTDDSDMQRQWMSVKREAKQRLVNYVKEKLDIDIPVDSLFDVQVKRIHEYKRQLMNILYCVYRYIEIKAKTPKERQNVVPRAVFFSGKAAPGYAMAKKIIKLINDVGKMVNNDPDIGGLLKIVFIPNYKVSAAEIIIPASDISQHISTAGTEASGTSNMKFVMNGGLIIGTLDGANVEIAEECGIENLFIFGAKTDEVPGLRHKLRFHSGKQTLEDEEEDEETPVPPICPALEPVFKLLKTDPHFSPNVVNPILDSLIPAHDHYLVTADFDSYVKAQEEVDACFRDQKEWARRSILMSAGSGKFSSDRTVLQYAEKIWGVEPTPRPDPRTLSFMKSKSGKSFSGDMPPTF